MKGSVHNKKGFTLVELCIVMAIVAIVSTMVVTSIILFSKQNTDIRADASFITDVSDIQKKIGDWITRYDTAGFDITHNGGQTAFTAKKGASESTIEYKENTIFVDNVAVSGKYANVSDVIFQIIEDTSAEGDVESNVAQIRITSKRNTGTETQTLIFPMFSDKTRERSVTGKNG